jgi:hypothetical protein
MQIFVDESGNLGTDGRYFVICCLVSTDIKRLKNIIKRSSVAFGGGSVLPEIKAWRLSLPQKQRLLNDLLKKDDFLCSYIVAEKQHLAPRMLLDKNVCYNYLAKHILKLLVKGANEDVEVILDNHTIKVGSLNSLSDYIRIEAYSKWGFPHGITFRYMDSRDCKALQVADFLSNTVYARYEHGSRHLYDQFQKIIAHSVRFPKARFGLDRNHSH